MKNRCKVCGYEGETEMVRAKEMMNATFDEFDYFICPRCHCLQIKDVPQNLGKYYDSDYYSYKKPDTSFSEDTEKLDIRVLDVGCGAGDYLCRLRRSGVVNLTGCDPFIEKDLHYENGVNIYKRTIHEMEGTYNKIYMNDSFEHMTDPHEVMESLHRLLARGGYATLTLPTFPNIAFDTLGIYWYQLDAPRHVFLHSLSSLQYLTGEHNLAILKFQYDSNPGQFIYSYLYKAGYKFWDQTKEVVETFFTKEQIDQMLENSKTANDNCYGDHMTVIIIRKEDIGFKLYGSTETENN